MLKYVLIALFSNSNPFHSRGHPQVGKQAFAPLKIGIRNQKLL